MERPNTAEPNSSESRMHYPTPTKAKIQGAVEFCDRMGILYFKKDVFRTFNVSHHAGWRALNQESSRRHHNKPDLPETRGRKAIVTPQKNRGMERIIEEEGFEARALTWAQLGYEVGLECSGRIIQIAMGTMDYHKCVACRKGWVNEKTARRRFDWAKVMLKRYPEKSDWHNVRFSDEVHFGWGPQGKLSIIRQPGERYCQDCIQQAEEPDSRDVKRHHCWAAVGHDFKSDIHYYNVPGNANGKMSQLRLVISAFVLYSGNS